MSPDYDSIKNEKKFNEPDLNDSGSIDDFLKELEAKEKDLAISSQMVLEIDADDVEANELAELEKQQSQEPNKTNYLPWILGIGGILVIGGIVWILRKKTRKIK